MLGHLLDCLLRLKINFIRGVNSGRLVTVAFVLSIGLFVSLATQAGPPKDLVLRGPVPPMESPKDVELSSRDSKASLPGQLFRALNLVQSDVLVKTEDRVSLKDPHSDFQLNCRSTGGFTCSFATPDPELGWTVSESSAQAVLYHALEALSKQGRGDRKTLAVKTDDDEIVLRLGDSETSSSLSCMKRTEESVQFNCRIRIRA